MLFIAKLTITYPFHQRDEDSYKYIHNRLVAYNRMIAFQFGYDYEIERLDYYNGEADFEIYRDVIYVYREIKLNRSFVAMAKILEGFAELTAIQTDTRIDVGYPDEFPPLCPPYYSPRSGGYQFPEELK